MSRHRYPCQAQAPMLVGWTDADLAVAGHEHACIHDSAEDDHRLAEHRCECGMTWRAVSTRPAPDTSWITYEDPYPSGLRILLWAKFGALLLLFGMLLAIGVAVVLP